MRLDCALTLNARFTLSTPTQANAGDRCGGGEQAASLVDRGEAARTAAVVLSRRLWQPREEVGITLCASFSVLYEWCVAKRGGTRVAAVLMYVVVAVVVSSSIIVVYISSSTIIIVVGDIYRTYKERKK